MLSILFTLGQPNILVLLPDSTEFADSMEFEYTEHVYQHWKYRSRAA